MQHIENFIVTPIEVGPMQNYVYLLSDRSSRDAMVVDPAWNIPLIHKKADENQLTIKAILLTHGHYDHCDGVKELLNQCDVPVYLSEKEAPFYTPDCAQLERTKDHQKIRVGNISVECLHTPGHTPGCQCFYVPGHLITGDTLFINGCGRCDLPGGDPHAMYQSLYQVIRQLPDETIIYPGHSYGSSSHQTLKEQKRTNPYLLCRDEKDFLLNRM
jgi:hydroxyacylglutathione hydrolase